MSVSHVIFLLQSISVHVLQQKDTNSLNYTMDVIFYIHLPRRTKRNLHSNILLSYSKPHRFCVVTRMILYAFVFAKSLRNQLWN